MGHTKAMPQNWVSSRPDLAVLQGDTRWEARSLTGSNAAGLRSASSIQQPSPCTELKPLNIVQLTCARSIA